MGGTFPAATQFKSVARRLRRDWTVEVVAGETEGARVFMRRWAANSSKVRSKSIRGRPPRFLLVEVIREGLLYVVFECFKGSLLGLRGSGREGGTW